MRIPIYQVDAFASRVFAGNPAAVCPLASWLPDEVMQAIAEENNLSETAFYVANGEDFDIRWFTPKAEIDLAGHPTLATAHTILTEFQPQRQEIRFHTRLCDTLTVERDGPLLVMNFPALPPAPADGLDAVADALGARPQALLAARDGFAVFASEAEVRALDPDMAKILALPWMGIIVTAPGDAVDFVSRFFAPGVGVPEDPVTGSTHCELIPYWAERLGKRELLARQVSRRGGEIHGAHLGDRVTIGGAAVTYLRGEIDV